MIYLSKEDEIELELFSAHRYLCSECPSCDREYSEWCDDECPCNKCDPKQQEKSYTNYCCIHCSEDVFKNNLEIYVKCKCKKNSLYHKKRKKKYKDIRKEILSSNKDLLEKYDVEDYTNKSRNQRFKALRYLYDRM